MSNTFTWSERRDIYEILSELLSSTTRTIDWESVAEYLKKQPKENLDREHTEVYILTTGTVIKITRLYTGRVNLVNILSKINGILDDGDRMKMFLARGLIRRGSTELTAPHVQKITEFIAGITLVESKSVIFIDTVQREGETVKLKTRHETSPGPWYSESSYLTLE